MSIAEHIERLKKLAEFDAAKAHREICDLASGKRKWEMCIPPQNTDSDMVLQAPLDSLSKILRAYEAVIKIQAEALELYADVGLPENDFIEKCLEQAMAERAADNVTINLGGLHISKKAREAIASVEKILEECK